MSLDDKQFDGMTDFGDFDESHDSCDFSDPDAICQESPLSWRRALISKAVANVKKAFENKADLGHRYEKGSLVFDEEAKRFARVVESRPGFLNLALLSGASLIRQDVDPIDFVKRNRSRLTLPQIASELAISEMQVIALLNKIELEEEASRVTKQAERAPVLKKSEAQHKKPMLKAFMPAELAKADSRPVIKMAAKTKKETSLGKMPSSPFSKLLPKGATTDPVVDPNGYIQQNFLLLSNRELALATGLSEHTVRRKLGEWGLKRKNYVNRV